MLGLEGVIGLRRTVQPQLIHSYWSRHRLGVPLYWMVCLVNEQRSFCRFWDCIQVLHFGLFCWPWIPWSFFEVCLTLHHDQIQVIYSWLESFISNVSFSGYYLQKHRISICFSTCNSTFTYLREMKTVCTKTSAVAFTPNSQNLEAVQMFNNRRI